LVIAHRLSTIEKADIIMVMDQGAHRWSGQPCRVDRPGTAILRSLAQHGQFQDEDKSGS